MKSKLLIVTWALALTVHGCQDGNPALQKEVQDFLDGYSREYQELYYTSSQAEWEANTHIVAGDTATANAVQRANEALAAFTGGTDNIQSAQQHLERKDELSDLQVKQLNTILFMAANNPQKVDSLVKERIRLDNELNNKLFGFEFRIDEQPVTPNDIDRILRESKDSEERLKAWNSSKEVGRDLKNGLDEIRLLRNETVRALGYKNYFSYQVSEYDMSREEMMDMMNRLVDEVYPLYRELHTYTRYELARKYRVEKVPKYLPAHWLPNRWGQDWSAIVPVNDAGLGEALRDLLAKDIIHIAEDFYISLGFGELPDVFWEKSSLYPLPEDAGYKKNNHASAWHVDLDKDTRLLMSVEPNEEWYETTHHELGHIYYFAAYSNAEVPIVLRRGASRAFHEAIGSLMGLASMQRPYLATIGLLPAETGNTEQNRIRALLKEALNYVVFIPFSAGVMTHFEHDLYVSSMGKDEFNKHWWKLKKQFQGIVPPSARGPEYVDATSKTHIINDPAQYYDYALSYLLLFQLHEHISSEILNQDTHATNYYGSKEVGRFLFDMMRPGATKDWQELIKEATGSNISAKPMLNYFQPLMDWLKEQNKGRGYTLPKKPR